MENQESRQYPANWDRWDISNHERWEREYLEARNTPGSAEHLAALLTGPQRSCPHPTKLHAGAGTKIPTRLGFFQKTDQSTSYIETAKLCMPCYESAVPSGFNVWSTYYKAAAQEDLPFDSDVYPPMYEAGTEQFNRFTDVLDVAEANRAENDEVVGPSTVRMPNNAEAREAWRWIQDQGKPFYVDQLHLSKPWDPTAADRREEDLRVARENAAAYEGADKGVLATGIGAAGPYSAAEQRMLAEGGRGVVLPATFGSGAVGQANFEADVPDRTEYHPQYGGKELEVPVGWPDNFEMPFEQDIDDVERDMRGLITGPTPDERARRSGIFEPFEGDEVAEAENEREEEDGVDDVFEGSRHPEAESDEEDSLGEVFGTHTDMANDDEGEVIEESSDQDDEVATDTIRNQTDLDVSASEFSSNEESTSESDEAGDGTQYFSANDEPHDYLEDSVRQSDGVNDMDDDGAERELEAEDNEDESQCDEEEEKGEEEKGEEKNDNSDDDDDELLVDNKDIVDHQSDNRYHNVNELEDENEDRDTSSDNEAEDYDDSDDIENEDTDDEAEEEEDGDEDNSSDSD